VSIDTELETWRQEWQSDTVALPDLKKKIRRQNRRTAAAMVATSVVLVFSTAAAIRTHGAFISGLAAGAWFASALLGSYAWRVRRGTWRPAGETTQAFLELCYGRAVAKARILRFAFRLLLVTIVLYIGFAAWHWRGMAWRGLAVLLALVTELFLMKRQERHKLQEVEETRKVMAQAAE
jgi:hypothetical protein